MQMLCDNEIADLVDIEITTSTITDSFMFYKKCLNQVFDHETHCTWVSLRARKGAFLGQSWEHF